MGVVHMEPFKHWLQCLEKKMKILLASSRRGSRWNEPKWIELFGSFWSRLAFANLEEHSFGGTFHLWNSRGR